jgi:hypothetical protein
MRTNGFGQRSQRGSALALTLVMTAIALAVLASAMAWSANSARLTHRSIQYTRSVAAAEAATEKVLSKITRDFLSGGDGLVADNVASYRQITPTTADSGFWSGWEFNDGAGNSDRTFVQNGTSTNYVLLTSTYAGLRGFVSSYTLAAHARETVAAETVVAGVLQEVQLARIPVFQFSMYSSGDLEISCGQPFNINGRVHANGELYVEPASVLTFQSEVTAVKNILFQRHPLDTRGDITGSAVYQQNKQAGVNAMSLPIGTNNSPEAIREIIQPSPSGENPNSAIGRLRYHNLADMILVVSNSGVSATSGRFDNFSTSVPASELTGIVTTNANFRDAREEKTVHPIDINVGVLAAWSATNTSLRPVLGSQEVSSIYVVDLRTLGGVNLGAVRVVNGRNLPERGLTVATARPLYVLGHYNQPTDAHLGSTNTTTTRPSSLVADAVTILSQNWSDAKSTDDLDSRGAESTTVNAAILTGVVETTLGKYSGGMENFPRFLETWGSANTFTYNGSMVKMFPTLYATNAWGKDHVYVPPKRNWAFDVNFCDAIKLPPLTPSLLKVFRGQWTTVPANQRFVSAPP